LIIYSLLKDNPKIVDIIIKSKEVVGPSIVLEIKKDNLEKRDFDSLLVNSFSRFFLTFALLILTFYSFHSSLLLINFYSKITIKSLLLVYRQLILNRII
jgi:hypothetical protein